MRIGELRQRITLQQKTVTRDSYGAEVISWTDVATVYAFVQPLQGREFFESQRINAEITAKITIRFRAGIRPFDRIKYGDRLFDIQSVINPDERRRELQLMVKEVIVG